MMVNGQPSHRHAVVVHSPAPRLVHSAQQQVGMIVSQDADKRTIRPSQPRAALEGGANLRGVRGLVPPLVNVAHSPWTGKARAWNSGTVPLPLDGHSSMRSSMRGSATPASQTATHLRIDSLGLSLSIVRVQQTLVHVNAVQPQGAARRSGQIAVGDQLVKINGAALTSSTSAEVHGLLHSTADRTVSLVFRRRDGTTYFTVLQKAASQQISHEASDDILREVLGDGFEDSIWNEALSADRSVAGSGAILHSTGTTHIHTAGSTGSAADLDEGDITSGVELPSLDVDLRTDASSLAPESPGDVSNHDVGHQPAIARYPPTEEFSEDSISFQAALAKVVSLTSTQDRKSENAIRTPRLQSKMPKVKTRDMQRNKFGGVGWQSPMAFRKAQEHRSFGKEASSVGSPSTGDVSSSIHKQNHKRQVPEVIYATSRKSSTSSIIPRVLTARRVTQEELTEAALGVIPLYEDNHSVEIPSFQSGRAMQSHLAERSSPVAQFDSYRLLERDGDASTHGWAPSRDDSSSRLATRTLGEEEKRVDSAVGGGMGPLLRAGAMMEVQHRTRSSRGHSVRHRRGRSQWSGWWQQLSAYSCVTLLAVSVTLKINSDQAISGWPAAKGWTLMLTPLWMLWLLGLMQDVALLKAAFRGELWTHLVAVSRSCGASASLAYGNTGLCASAALLALKADGVLESGDSRTLAWIAIAPALLWMWMLFTMCAAQVWGRRSPEQGIETVERPGVWVAALLAPCATFSLVVYVAVQEAGAASADSPLWGRYGVFGPIWGWLVLLLVAQGKRLRQSVRDVDNEALATSIQFGADALVWIAVSVWAFCWLRGSGQPRGLCLWPVPWIGAWVLKMLAFTAGLGEAEKITDVQVHMEGEELYLTWARSGTVCCHAHRPVLFEVELLDLSGPGTRMTVHEGRQPRCRLAARWLGGEAASLGVRVAMTVLLSGQAEAMCTIVIGGNRKVSVEEREPPAGGPGGLAVVSPWPSPMMEEGSPEVDNPVSPTARSRERPPGTDPLAVGTSERRRTSVMSYLMTKARGATPEESSSPTGRQLEVPATMNVDLGKGASQQLLVDVGYFQVDVEREGGE